MARRLWGFRPLAAATDGDQPRDVKRAEAKQKLSRTAADQSAEALLLMRNFEDSSHGWFWSLDEAGQFTYLSQGISSLLGGHQDDFIGSRFADVFVQADDDLTGRRTLPFVLAKQSVFERLTVRAIPPDIDHCWSISGQPQFNGSGRFTGYRGSAVDVTEHRRSSAHVSQLAKYDALTGLPNRLRMAEVLEASVRASGPCAVLLIDLDRFKQVNDTLGHPAGDALLKQVANRLVKITGDREKVFRLGGDEFEIILQNCQDRGIIGDLAKDIIAGVSQPYSIEGSRCVIGASIGVAIAPADGPTKDELMRNADLALYASKAGGRGRFRFFSSELLQTAKDRRTLEDDLRDALAKGEISLAYQPIINAVTNRMTGVEALIRWRHPQRGNVSPAVFIPIAEEASLIASLGEWVLRKACEDAAAWPGDLRVAVNVSPVQFVADGFPATVISALATSGLTPDRLELEITEGVFLGEGAETDTMFSRLKDIGVRLALDDFGTGYSSLGYLRNAPFDKIKIDQTFVREATSPGSRNSAIIAAIVALAEALDMETTAEGIEYMDQLHLIRSLRVSHAQGWVYSKAVPNSELMQRLETGDWTIEPSGPTKQRSERQAVFRKVGVIHEARYDSVIMRNLSESGALIDGPAGIAAGELIVVDFGDGQLSFARVIRSEGQQHGIAFEQQLVDDGNGGYCTSQRISPYLLSANGLPSPGDPDKATAYNAASLPLKELAAKLGMALPPQSRPQLQGTQELDFTPAEALIPTFRQLSTRYMETVDENFPGREIAKRDLRNHVLPRFGQLRLNEVSQADVFAWLAAKVEVEDHPAGTDSRLHRLLSEMWSLAVRLELPGAEPNPLEGRMWTGSLDTADAPLTFTEALHLIAQSRNSSNRQLKFIISLLMVTRARVIDLLKAQWDDVDLARGIWTLPMNRTGKVREVVLTRAATDLLSHLPRWDGCPYLVGNPITKQPYKSVLTSWEVARRKADLPCVEIDDLRFADICGAARQNDVVEAVIGRGQGEGAGANEALAA